jgi:oligoribonuclease NrnB/cAMP/cGMP phosphodiesterase (DHH superfamily)
MIYCIAHDRDVDGIGCHAILHRYAELDRQRIRHVFTDYDRFCRDISKISASGAEIVIADLGYNEGFSHCLDSLKKLCARNNTKWFDHHDWGDAKIDCRLESIITRELCAAELLKNYYLPEDEIAATIAALAHSHDFREENETAWKLYDVISSGYDKERLVKTLAKGVFWNPELEEVCQSYSKVKEKGYSYLEKHSKLYQIGGWKCVLGFSLKSLSSTLATEHLLKKKADLVICLWEDGKISFRRNNKNINLKMLASAFRGGGREEAAGGFYGDHINESNYLEVFEDVAEKIRLLCRDSNIFRP